MAGRSIEKMAQSKFDELMRERSSFVSDVVRAEEEMDRVADKPYYPTQDKDIDNLISLRDDAQHNIDIIEVKLTELLDEFGYCIDVDSVVDRSDRGIK